MNTVNQPPPVGNFGQAPEPKKGTRKAPKRGANAGAGGSNAQAPAKKKSKAAAVQEPPPPEQISGGHLSRPETNEELEWIDKCKRVIGNKVIYNEFLKVLNLFSQEVIDAKTLVEKVEPFLTRSPELFEWFKRFVKYDEEQIVCE
jgi:paired amphipathic helix protein Sin3a